MKVFVSFLIFFGLSFHTLGSDLTFDPKEIKKVSILFVGEAAAIESSFGHMALRLSTEKQTSFQDYSVEFVADEEGVTNPILFYIRGSGLISPFETKVFVKNFEDFKVEKNDEQNREVKSIDLNLTPEQVFKIANFVKEFQEGKIKQNYYFLTDNCAGIPLKFIEELIGKDLQYTNVPNKAYEKLLKNSIAGEEIIYPSSKEKRLSFYDKYLGPYEEEIKNILPLTEFKKLLGSHLFSERIKAFTILAYLYQKGVISKKTYKWSFVKFRNLEIGQNKFSFRMGFSPEIVGKNKLYLIEHRESMKGSFSNFKTKLVEGSNKELAINYHYSYRKNGKPSNHNLKQKYALKNIPNTRIEQGKIFFKNIEVGLLFKSSNQEEVVTNSIGEISIHFPKDGYYYFKSFYSASLDSKPESLSEKQLKSRPFLLNSNKFNDGVGACFGFVWLQQAFIERAFFFENKKNSLTEDELLGLVQELVNGKFVIFQGFKNIKDLTKFIGKAKLTKLLNEIQNQKHLSKADGLWESIFNQEILNKKNIKSVKTLIDSGYGIPLVLGFYSQIRGAISQREPIGHIIYVYDLVKLSEDEYKVIGYDPNFGVGHYYNLRLKGEEMSELVLAGDGKAFMNKSLKYEVRPILTDINFNKLMRDSFYRNIVLEINGIENKGSQSFYSYEIFKLTTN